MAKSSAKRGFKMDIDGKWVGSESGRTFDVVSPASGEILGTLPKGTSEDAKAAVDAAVGAQDRIRTMPINEHARLGVRITEEIGRSIK